MRQKVLTIIAVLIFMPMWMFGQSYNELWDKVKEAEKKDLPKTMITHLTAIEQKAAKGKDYGMLLKATLYRSKMQAEIAPDSLAPAVERLAQQEQQAKDVVLKAVYATILYRVYADNPQLSENREELLAQYRQTALASPKALAKAKTDQYVPFVETADDSEIYGHDILHIIGMEFDAWQLMHDYYRKVGNRRAACLTALEILKQEPKSGVEKLAESKYIARLDSLIQEYRDVDEAGHLYTGAETVLAPQRRLYLYQGLQVLLAAEF